MAEVEQEWLSKFPQACDRLLANPMSEEIQVKEAEEIVEEVLFIVLS
jgi:phosphoribosylformylglycinamidine (FGAM) synthase PurS component